MARTRRVHKRRANRRAHKRVTHGRRHSRRGGFPNALMNKTKTMKTGNLQNMAKTMKLRAQGLSSNAMSQLKAKTATMKPAAARQVAAFRAMTPAKIHSIAGDLMAASKAHLLKKGANVKGLSALVSAKAGQLKQIANTMSANQMKAKAMSMMRK